MVPIKGTVQVDDNLSTVITTMLHNGIDLVPERLELARQLGADAPTACPATESRASWPVSGPAAR